jgi:hypothetical protein
MQSIYEGHTTEGNEGSPSDVNICRMKRLVFAVGLMSLEYKNQAHHSEPALGVLKFARI